MTHLPLPQDQGATDSARANHPRAGHAPADRTEADRTEAGRTEAGHAELGRPGANRAPAGDDGPAQALARQIDRLTRGLPDGAHDTAAPGMRLLRATGTTLPHRVVYKPALCVVVQGAKQVLFGDRILRYGNGQALVVSLEMPVNGCVVEASRERPFLGLNIYLDPGMIRTLIEEMPAPPARPAQVSMGAFVQEVEARLAGCIARGLELLATPEAAPLLFPALLRELSFWLLSGPNGGEVAKIALPDDRARRIARAIHHLRDRFREPVNIAELAGVARMSPSSFHDRFKAMTGLTPLQFQKQLRLLEARRLMAAGAANATSAAFQVGYESASQFSREYARMFGAPPRRDIRRGIAPEV